MIPTVIDDDIDAARARNRKTLQGYVALPNYRNYWIEAGYEAEMTAVQAAFAARDADAVLDSDERPMARRLHAVRFGRPGTRGRRGLVRRRSRLTDPRAVVHLGRPGQGLHRTLRGVRLNKIVDATLELLWIPLGAGAVVVRLNGRVFERLSALAARRPACDLYHSALLVHLPEGRYVIEVAPRPDWDRERRGVVADGAVGHRWLGRFRLFRYEVRRWLDGVLPDEGFAVSTVRIELGLDRARRVIDLLASVPAPVWGRDELDAGEMWNSNSVVSWVLCRAGIDLAPFVVPVGGRAPGWDAGIEIAARRSEETPDSGGSSDADCGLGLDRSDSDGCSDRVGAVGEGRPLVVIEHLEPRSQEFVRAHVGRPESGLVGLRGDGRLLVAEHGDVIGAADGVRGRGVQSRRHDGEEVDAATELAQRHHVAIGACRGVVG